MLLPFQARQFGVEKSDVGARIGDLFFPVDHFHQGGEVLVLPGQFSGFFQPIKGIFVPRAPKQGPDAQQRGFQTVIDRGFFIVRLQALQHPFEEVALQLGVFPALDRFRTVDGTLQRLLVKLGLLLDRLEQAQVFIIAPVPIPGKKLEVSLLTARQRVNEPV